MEKSREKVLGLEEGPGQVRGVSWLAPILLTVNEFDQLQDALLVGAKIAAIGALSKAPPIKSPRSFVLKASFSVTNHEPQAKNWRNIITDNRVASRFEGLASVMDRRLSGSPLPVNPHQGH